METDDMWGAIDDASSALISLHLALVERLADYTWQRIQIWNSTISVHEFIVCGASLAFDLKEGAEGYQLTLVVRKRELTDAIKESLKLENKHYTINSKQPNRLELKTYERAKTGLARDVAEHIRDYRNAIARAFTDTQIWHDLETGLTLSYTTKPERRESPYLVFMFTSIRTKPHWIDFDGPNGSGLQNIRARIVFVNDDLAEEYTYNFANDGKTSPAKATLNFIQSYISENEYAREKVILAGMSKGGTSAILAGSHLSGCTILTLAPQLAPGKYLEDSNRITLLNQMASRQATNKSNDIDSLFWNYLDNSEIASGRQSVYVLTSDYDPHCTSGLERFRRLISEYKRSTLYVHQTSETQASSHLKTVHHMMPLFVFLLGSLTMGLRPRF